MAGLCFENVARRLDESRLGIEVPRSVDRAVLPDRHGEIVSHAPVGPRDLLLHIALGDAATHGSGGTSGDTSWLSTRSTRTSFISFSLQPCVIVDRRAFGLCGRLNVALGLLHYV